jgi:hypothetical protein
MPKLSQARKKAAGQTKMGGTGETKAADLHHEPILVPRIHRDDMTVLAIDPGETHVGLVVGSRNLTDGPGLDPAGMDEYEIVPPGWVVRDVAELTPPEFVRWFRRSIQHFDMITCEKFTLYPHLAKEQVGSEMPTSKLIGWVEFTIMLWNEMVHEPGNPALGHPEIQYYSYPANIHAGTSSVMKKKGIPFVSPLTPDHARSAELHFWHMLIRLGLVPGVVLA